MCMHACIHVWVGGHPSIHYAHQCILITFVTVKHADERYLVGFSWPLKEITIDVAQCAFTLVFHGLQQTQQPFSLKPHHHRACSKHNNPSALNFFNSAYRKERTQWVMQCAYQLVNVVVLWLFRLYEGKFCRGRWAKFRQCKTDKTQWVTHYAYQLVNVVVPGLARLHFHSVEGNAVERGEEAVQSRHDATQRQVVHYLTGGHVTPGNVATCLVILATVLSRQGSKSSKIIIC